MPRVRGVDQLKSNLRALSQASGGSLLDKACIAGLTPMKQETEINARRLRQPRTPKGGHLDQGVVIAKVESSGRFYRKFWLSFRRRARKLAHLVELGTAPHWQPRWRGGWMHPGARPKPFFRPAFDAEKGDVALHVGKTLWAGIAETIRGVRR